MSTLSAVIDDLFENVSDAEFWKFVSKAQWPKDHDYDRIKKMILQTMNKESASKLDKKYREFYNELHRHIFDDVIGVGDDSYGDLISHIVGTGKNLYNAVMDDYEIAQRMIDDSAFHENFGYSFPDDVDWKLTDPEYYKKRATKYLENLSTATNKVSMEGDARILKDMIRRLRNVETGNFRKAIDGWDKEQYHFWGQFVSRLRNEEGVHYGHSNLLNDVKRFAV